MKNKITMNPNDILTKADLEAFENRLNAKLSEAFSKNKQEFELRFEPLLTRKQVLAYFQITDNTLSEMTTNGLPFVLVNKRPRYDKNKVMEYLTAQSKFKL